MRRIIAMLAATALLATALAVPAVAITDDLFASKHAPGGTPPKGSLGATPLRANARFPEPAEKDKVVFRGCWPLAARRARHHPSAGEAMGRAT